MRSFSAMASRCLAFAFALGCNRTLAQVYEFAEETPSPVSGSLEAHYAFYIYNTDDTPDKANGEKPYVEFRNFVAHSGSHEKSDTDLAQYKGLQVSLMKVGEFDEMINPTSFCYNTALKLNTPKGMTSVPAISEDIRVSRRNVGDRVHAIDNSGIYYLVVSNCGWYSNLTISGTVVVKNTFGHLPGNEYHKKGFFMSLSLAYVAAGLAWLYKLVAFRQNLIGIQFSISVILLLGLAECFVWIFFLASWNATGVYSQTVLAFTLYSSTAKRLYSFMLVLVASMGWGVTSHSLDACTLVKIFIASTIYFVASLFQELVLFFRHSLLLKISFLFVCSLPVTIWCAVCILWIFLELRGTIGLLKERHQEEKLKLYQRFQAVLVGSVATALFTVVFQAFDTFNSLSARWYYQWFPNVAVSHLIFFSLLVAFMILWAPHANSDVYAYSQQLDCDEMDKEDAENVVAEIQNNEDDNLTKVSPEPIGATAM